MILADVSAWHVGAIYGTTKYGCVHSCPARSLRKKVG